MRIRERYVFNNNNKNRNLIIYLDKYNIKYNGDEISIVLEVFKEKPYYKELKSVLNKHNYEPTFVEKVYTKQELRDAKWLTVRSSYRLGYPRPEDDYKHITYDDINYCSKCGSGLVQKDSFYISKLPNFKSRHFYQPFWIEDELFVSTKVMNILKNENVSGIDSWDVKKFRKNEIIDYVKQIKINTILPKGLIIDEDDYKKEINCSKCGTHKYILKGSTVLKIDKNLLNNAPDFVKSYEQFGDGRICARELIVSQRVYKIITENKLGRGLIFEPIVLL